MNEKNLVKILAAAAIILGIVFISVICIDTHESTSLSVKSSDTLKDGDAYSVELCDSKGNPIANQNISISFGSNSFNLTTDENGIAVLKISNVPAGEYDIKIQYDGNSHYKNTSAVHHAVILKIEKNPQPRWNSSKRRIQKKDWWLPNCWIQLYGRHGICTGWRFKW